MFRPALQSNDAPVLQKLVSKAEVVQLYRYPGISGSKAETLLRKVRMLAEPSLENLSIP